MKLSNHDIDFLRSNHQAAMITIGRDGQPKVSRVGVALVGDKLWSSGTRVRRTTRVRTALTAPFFRT